MKKVKNSTKILVEKCAKCGRETPHYVNDKGEVKCSICHTTSRKVKVSVPKEVIFEMDESFDKALNPVKVVAEVEKPEVIEVPEEVGPTFDDELPL